jgi:hypothetical protein
MGSSALGEILQQPVCRRKAAFRELDCCRTGVKPVLGSVSKIPAETPEVLATAAA